MPGRVLKQVLDEDPQPRLPAAHEHRLVGQLARPPHARMTRSRAAEGDADEVGELDLGALQRRGVAARERLQPDEQVDEPAVLGQRIVDHPRALAVGHARDGG